MGNLSNKLFDKLDTHQLPSLDQVLVEIISACSQNDVTFYRLAEIIDTDPALTVKILTIVNSPAYAPVQPMNTLERALITLGIETIKTLVITTSLRQVLNGFRVQTSFDRKKYWRQSLQCGLMVKELALLTGYTNSDEAYLAGLLVNIGELVIASNFPMEFQYSSDLTGDERLLFERRQFGFTRYDVGAWVVGQWDLNPFVSDAILYQQESKAHILNSHVLVRFLYLANHLSGDNNRLTDRNYDLAEQMFGLSASMVRHLVGKVNNEVLQIARSLLIDLPELDSDSLSSAPEIYSTTQEDNIHSENSSYELIGLVKENALSDAVKPLIQGASDPRELLNRLQVCAFVLFGCNKALLFATNPDKKTLVGLLAEDQGDLISQFSVPVDDECSAIAGAYRQKTAAMSFGQSKKSLASIVDRQVAKFFSTDGLYCIPIPESNNVTTVLVLGVSKIQANQYRLNRQLMEEFATIVGQTFVEFGDQQDKPVPEKGLDVRAVQALVHEANNPLTILKNYIAVLANKLDGGFREELQIVSDEMERVGRIIRQISEETYVGEEDADINDLIGDLLKIYKDSYFIPHSVNVSFIPGKKMGRIKTNTDALKQILTNLIKNAIEAMPESGKIRVTTRGDFQFGKKNYIEIVVADNGPGMSSEFAKHMFDRPAKQEGFARGYGLVIVKNLVKKMGGLIHVKTREHKGTSFQILLPRQKSLNR